MLYWGNASVDRVYPCCAIGAGTRTKLTALTLERPAPPRGRLICSEIGNLQQLAVADPGSGQVGLGLARSGGVAAGLMQLCQPVVRPAVGWRSAQRASELALCFGVAAGLQQRRGKRLP